MTDNRSLDEFAGPAGGGEDDQSADGGSDPDESADAADDATDAAEAKPSVEIGDDVDDVDAGGPGDGEADDPSGADPGEAAVESPASTYAWSPDGGECVACGGTVGERWRDGDGLVCLDCKEW